MTALRMVKVRPNGDAYWTCSRWPYRFVFTLLETKATDRSVSFGFPRPSVGELSVSCQHDWLRSWTGHLGGATSRFTRCCRVCCVSQPTPRPGACYYEIYVNVDICSRYAVGWMPATRDELAVLAEKLIADRRETTHQPRSADTARRPRLVDDLQDGCVPAADLGVTQFVYPRTGRPFTIVPPRVCRASPR